MTPLLYCKNGRDGRMPTLFFCIHYFLALSFSRSCILSSPLLPTSLPPLPTWSSRRETGRQFLPRNSPQDKFPSSLCFSFSSFFFSVGVRPLLLLLLLLLSPYPSSSSSSSSSPSPPRKDSSGSEDEKNRKTKKSKSKKMHTKGLKLHNVAPKAEGGPSSGAVAKGSRGGGGWRR